jgi:hypothetical protein
MKKLIALIIICLMISLPAFSQVGINSDESSPDASSMLDVKSITKGLLIPRMTTALRTAIPSPAEGLMVYDTDLGSLCFFRSGTWIMTAIVPGGSTSTNQVAFWSSPGILSGNNNLYWNNSNSWLGIGTSSPNQQLELTGSFRFPETSSSTTGVIYKGGTRFIHDYKPASNNGSNTFLGVEAGNFTMTGSSPWDASYNTGVGRQALSAVSSGSYNSAVGSWALRANSTGAYNTAVGAEALYTNSTGNGNTATGDGALYSNTTGGYNSGFGINALNANTTGTNNTAVGSSSLLNNTIGSDNTAVGYSAFHANTTSGGNTALGNNALYTQSYDNGGAIWSSHNTAVGSAALYLNQPTSTSTGEGNTAVGNSSLYTNATGKNNTAIGYLADVSTGALDNTIAIGYDAKATASDQVRLGNSNILTLYCYGAWYATSASKPNMVVNSSGQIMQSTAIIPSGTGTTNQVAYWSGSGALSGNNNLYWDNANSRLGIGVATPNQQLELTGAFRFPATSSATTGVIFKGVDRFIHDYKPAGGLGGNIFLGVNAGNFTMTATGSQSSYNTATGNLSLTSLTTGSDNTATGFQSLTANSSGSSNTATGLKSLNANTSGILNVAIGSNALLYTVTGGNNTAVGSDAGRGVSGNSFSANSLFGYQAGYALSTGSNNILLGYNAGSNITTGSNNIVIAYMANAPSATASNQMVIGSPDFLYGDLLNYRVGLGTTTPGQKLEVKDGNLLMSNNNLAGEIRLAEPSAGGVNYTAFKAQSQTGNVTYTLPAADGASGTVMSTNGAGTLSWTTPNAGDITAVGSMLSGDAFAGTAANGQWLGLGPSPAGRITFEDLTTDEINIMNANVGIGTITPGQQLELTGNIELPASSVSGGIIFKGANRFLHNFGTHNVFLGELSGNLTSAGLNNTGVGDSTLYSASTGGYNVALGFSALKALNTANGNTVVGAWAGLSIQSAGYNTIMGYQAGKYTIADRNTLIGCEAGMSNTTGIYNVFLGHQSGYNNTTGNNSTALGCRALFSQTGYAGYNALNNTAVGFEALYSNNPTTTSNGRENVAVGHQSLRQNQTGYNNTSVGTMALYTNTTGYNNTAIGSYALDLNSTGQQNTALGTNALSSSTSSYNTGIGDGALQFLGSGQRNTAVGMYALDQLTTGSDNTAIGYMANSASNCSNSVAIGYSASATTDNQIRLGNSSIQSFYCHGAYDGAVGATNVALYADNTGKIGYYTSSARYKDDIFDMEEVEWLYELRPVNFTYKSDEINKKQYGLIAEEVEKVNPDFVHYNSDGLVETVSYNQLISPMIKAIQDQQAVIEELQKRIETLEKEQKELSQK